MGALALPLMIAGSVGSAAASIKAGQTQQEGLEEQATMIEKFGLEDVTNLQDYGAAQLDYLQDQADFKKDHQLKVADLYDRKTKLFEAGIKRDIRDEKKAAGDRSRMRHKTILDTLGTHAAVRSAQNIQAYEGHALNMQKADYTEFLRDEIIDRGDTAERVVDLKYFGGEQAKMMRAQTSLLREYAGTEYESAIDARALTSSALDMQVSSMQNATSLEAAGMRASGRYARQQGMAGAFGSLLNLGTNFYTG
tara:strand:- start:11097 stop:11849 length:753 start_codon:yes stop_codon:yes gene_type:complete